jgi:cytochrome c553
MSMKQAVWIALLALLPAAAAAAERPEWAYGPEQTGQSVPRRPDDGKLKQAPGSAKFYTQAQIDDPMNPPDWFPDEHPPMPRVVAHGNGTTVRACIGCHLANGNGHPENSRLPGATSAYLARQLADFRSGARAGVTSKVMIGIAKAMTEDEMRASSDYFAALKVVRWTRVVETDTVPKTYWRGNRRLPLAEGGSEPIGNRIIELPEDPARNLLRDPHSGNISHVPVGTLAKGEALVATGGAGKTIPCAICHGPALRGIGDVPSIAGLSPLTVARQLYDMQSGDRTGPMVALMKAVVDKLSADDILAISAYVASREP